MPRRQRSTWGCVQRMRKGVYRLRYNAVTQNGRERVSETVYGTRRDAEAALAARRVECEEKATGAAAPIAFSRCVEEWWRPVLLERIEEGSFSNTTYRSYMSMLERHVLPRWGEVPVRSIAPLDMQEWLLTMTHDVAVRCRSIMQGVIAYAELYGAVEVNVAARRYRMPAKRPSRTKAVYRLAQIDECVRRLRGSAGEVPAILCGLGSCRVGEGCGANVWDVSFSHERGMLVARVDIHQQLVREGIKAKLKNPQSVRTVVVPEPWSARVMEIVEERLASGSEWLNDDGTGEPVPRMRLQLWWNDQYKEGGLLAGMEPIPITNLRNSWETMMRWEVGIDKDKVDAMMGHAGKDTRAIYYDRPAADVFADTVAQAFAAKPFVPEVRTT